MSTETEQGQRDETEQEDPERDGRFIQHMTQIDSDCRRGGVDMSPVRDEVAAVVDAARVLKDSAAANDLNLGKRRIIADSIGKAIREGME